MTEDREFRAFSRLVEDLRSTFDQVDVPNLDHSEVQLLSVVDLAHETDWDRKLNALAERSLHEPITLVGGVPSWLLMLFQRLMDLKGAKTLMKSAVYLLHHHPFEPVRDFIQSETTNN